MADSFPPLALQGGPRACDVAPVWPLPDEEVRAALLQAYADGSWGSYHGHYCRALCQALAEFFQTPWVTLCCSGTLAVELALRAAGVTMQGEVLLAGYDFPGNFRAIEAIGATPVLVDLDPENWNLDPRLVESALSKHTQAILVSHLHGGLAPMQRLVELARARGLAVIEDACQAPGAMVQGRLAGAWGDVGVLSFGGSKLLTAGRGGAILSSRQDIHQRAKLYSERGNLAFPLSELQAAVLLPQLSKLSQHNAQRTASVQRLAAGICDVRSLHLRLNHDAANQPAFYKVGLRYNPVQRGVSRAEFLATVQAEGVPLAEGFRGFARRSSRRCRLAGDMTQSRLAAECTVVLHHPILLQGGEAVESIIGALRKVQWHLDRDALSTDQR